MKKFTRDRVVPTMSASVACEIFVTIRSGVLFAVTRQEQQCASRPLLARIKELIDQILLDPDVSGQHVRDETV